MMLTNYDYDVTVRGVNLHVRVSQEDGWIKIDEIMVKSGTDAVDITEVVSGWAKELIIEQIERQI